MYAPEIGRFVQTDPIGYGDGMNNLQYAHSDPINERDPTGADSVTVTGRYDPNPAGWIVDCSENWSLCQELASVFANGGYEPNFEIPLDGLLFDIAIGDLPPTPPGFDPKTWTVDKDKGGRWTLTDPKGNKWSAHPEDKGHWRHWDKTDPNGKDLGRWPEKSVKPWEGQKRPPYGPQSGEDPSGSEPSWKPPESQMSAPCYVSTLSPCGGGFPGVFVFPTPTPGIPVPVLPPFPVMPGLIPVFP
jgi:hypothetical protein